MTGKKKEEETPQKGAPSENWTHSSRACRFHSGAARFLPIWSNEAGIFFFCKIEQKKTLKMEESSNDTHTSDSESDGEWARRPRWHRDAWELVRSYETLQDDAEVFEGERAGGRGVERRKLLVLRYLRDVAERKARELSAILRSPPRWTEERGGEYVERAREKYGRRVFLFEQLFGEEPFVRRNYMSAEDRETVLDTIADPEARRIVAILTSKTGVALRAALAVGKLRSRVKRNADANWNPDGARAQALLGRYRGDALFS